MCAILFSQEKKKKDFSLQFTFTSISKSSLKTKCFVSLSAEHYEGEIFEIIVVRLLLLVLARAMNSRSAPFYKKMVE